jgi:hypothetical protein
VINSIEDISRSMTAAVFSWVSSILHCPQSRKGLGQLLDNLHYYFSVTLSRILDEMHRNPDWGINEAILSCQNRYKYLIALLKTNPEQLCISDFFPHPEVEVNTTLLVRLTLAAVLSSEQAQLQAIQQRPPGWTAGKKAHTQWEQQVARRKTRIAQRCRQSRALRTLARTLEDR